jgi:hypothetical protein
MKTLSALLFALSVPFSALLAGGQEKEADMPGWPMPMTV